MNNANVRYWVSVASKDHVKSGILAGIAQACHGKASPLKRMRKDDFIIFYSGKQTMGRNEMCQEFTAIGKVADDEVYQFKVSENFFARQGATLNFFKAQMFPSYH